MLKRFTGFLAPINHFERALEQWTRNFGVAALQISLGVVFVWLGILKLLDVDPTRPVQRVAFYDVDLRSVLPVLGTWEVLIGIALLLPLLSLPRRLEDMTVRAAIFLLFGYVAGIVLLAFGYPDRLFVPSIPHLSVMGEFLVRNFVFAVAGLVVAGHLRTAPEASGVEARTPKLPPRFVVDGAENPSVSVKEGRQT